jgi:hypothetical protein
MLLVDKAEVLKVLPHGTGTLKVYEGARTILFAAITLAIR